MMKQGIKFFYVMCLMGVIFASMSLIGVNTEEEAYDIGDLGGMPNSPYCLQMYTSIEKYSEQYNIPKYIAYNVAYLRLVTEDHLIGITTTDKFPRQVQKDRCKSSQNMPTLL